MKEIDKKLDQWIHNSVVKAEIRAIIEDYVLDEKVNAFKAGWAKGAVELEYKTNTNKDG
jgi:plasmid stability protein